MSNMQKSTGDEHVETSPMAFTIQLDDPKPEGRKLKIHDKLSSFALKHRRNPSLPEFKATKPTRSFDSAEVKPSYNKFGSHLLSTPKAGYHSEGYFSSDQDEESIKLRNRSNNMPRTKISPVIEDKLFCPGNSSSNIGVTVKEKKFPNLRRSSMNDIDLNDMLKPNLNSTFTREHIESDDNMECNKSDTVSEAGTYTVEKDDSPSGDNETATEEETINTECTNDTEGRSTLTPENHKWINEWVKKVAEESSLPQLSGSASSSASASKIPSPVNTMPKLRESVVLRRSDRVNQNKINGSLHRRSSSLSAKDFAENRKSDSSLETESYLQTTESVMIAMQSRMRQNLNLNLSGDITKKTVPKKERLHPPSTASDTDTNSDNDAKVFKKPLGAPFTSARLNRAFNLRRGRSDNEPENLDQQKRSSISPAAQLDKRPIAQKVLVSATATSKAKPITSPFARTDCGRFSMRSTVSLSKTTNAPSPVQKKDNVKKTGVRSNSSLSSKEMEFQNWKRRKSFDPMKAAAEGKKKEAAKKAAVSHSILSPSSSSHAMTQSVNLGTTIQTRSGTAVLRSASFHTSPHVAGSLLDQDDDISPEDDPASPSSSCFSHNLVLPPNSPNRVLPHRASFTARTAAGSRGSLNSEVHSSPSRKARAEFIDNLLVSAIAELSIGLKIKSCDLLKKLEVHCEGEERISRMKEELAGCESQRGSASSSPAHKSASRDFPQILKNLKSLENVLQVVDDVLFGESGPDD